MRHILKLKPGSLMTRKTLIHNVCDQLQDQSDRPSGQGRPALPWSSLGAPSAARQTYVCRAAAPDQSALELNKFKAVPWWLRGTIRPRI